MNFKIFFLILYFFSFGILHSMNTQITQPMPLFKQSSQNNEFIIKAQHHTAELGFIRYIIYTKEQKGWISELFVEKEYRKKGIAKQLLYAASLHMQQEKCNKVSGFPAPLYSNIASLYLEEPYGQLYLFFAASLFFKIFNINLPFMSLIPSMNKLGLKTVSNALLCTANNSAASMRHSLLASLYALYKLTYSRNNFYKQLGAKINHSRIATFDLTQDLEKNKKFHSKL